MMLTRRAVLRGTIAPLREQPETYFSKFVANKKKASAAVVYKKSSKLWEQSKDELNKKAFVVAPVTRAKGGAHRVPADSKEYPVIPPPLHLRHQPENLVLAQQRKYALDRTKRELNAEQYEEDDEEGYLAQERGWATPEQLLPGYAAEEELEEVDDEEEREEDKGSDGESRNVQQEEETADESLSADEEALIDKCFLCHDPTSKIEAMNVPLLSRYVSPIGDLLPRSITNNCARHQRVIAKTFRRAKQMGLLSYKHGFIFHSPYDNPTAELKVADERDEEDEAEEQQQVTESEEAEEEDLAPRGPTRAEKRARAQAKREAAGRTGKEE